MSTPSLSRSRGSVRRRLRLRQVAEAFAGLAALMAMAIGIPVALWLLGGWPLPHGLQGPTELWEGLLRPIPDAFWAKALITLTWVYWLHFMTCLVAEAIATVRGRIATRVPAGRLNQALASQLIGAILLLAPASTPLRAAAAAVPPAHDAAYVAAAAHPAVVRHDPDVADRSTPVRAADPAEPPDETSANRAGGERQRYVVRQWTPGQRRDTLWSIAERYLRDERGRPAPQRWPEIFALNRDRPLPDPPGGTFTNPRWIFPGQQLLLPTDAVRLPAPPAAPSPAQPPSSPPTPAPPQASPTTAPTTSQPAPPPPRGAPTAPPSLPTTPQGTDRHPGTSHLVRIVAALAGSGLLAAGVVAALARLRRVQQHRRRHGRRIKLPTGEAVEVEVGLRAAQEPETAQRLDLSLRALAGAIRQADLPVPPVQAVLVSAAGLDVLLGRAVPVAPPPFTPAGSADRWRLPEQVDDAELARFADGVPPLPGLVTLGHAGQDRLLVNLEHAGLLTVTGPAHETTGLLVAMATELATSTWSGHLDLILVGFGDELAPLAQVRRADRLQEILPDLERRLERVGQLPEASHHGTSLAARIATATPDSWNPTIILCAEEPDPDALERLLRLATQQGPVPLGAAVPGEHPHTHGIWS